MEMKVCLGGAGQGEAGGAEAAASPSLHLCGNFSLPGKRDGQDKDLWHRPKAASAVVVKSRS